MTGGTSKQGLGGEERLAAHIDMMGSLLSTNDQKEAARHMAQLERSCGPVGREDGRRPPILIPTTLPSPASSARKRSNNALVQATSGSEPEGSVSMDGGVSVHDCAVLLRLASTNGDAEQRPGSMDDVPSVKSDMQQIDSTEGGKRKEESPAQHLGGLDHASLTPSMKPPSIVTSLGILEDDYIHHKRTPQKGANKDGGFTPFSRTSEADSDNKRFQQQHKWFYLWWRVTFVPFCWKQVKPAQVWGKKEVAMASHIWKPESLHLNTTAARSPLPSRHMQSTQSLLDHSDTLPDKNEGGFTRLSERSKPRFSEASMPRFSMRLLLEDNTLLHNILLHNPRAERSGDDWSTQPVMNKLDGWQSRTSQKVDGPCKKGSPCKSRQHQHAPNVAKTHKLLQLRATHSRHRILKMAWQEYIEIGRSPFRFNTENNPVDHSLTDMERYMHTWRDNYPDGGRALKQLLHSNSPVPRDPRTSCASALEASSPEKNDKKEHNSSTKKNEASSADAQDESESRDTALSRRQDKSKRALEERKQLSVEVAKLKARGRRAHAAASAIQQSESRLQACWQSYLNAHTLLSRKKALVDIECALESGRGVEEEEHEARRLYEESLVAKQVYTRILDTSAKIIARFFRRHFGVASTSLQDAQGRPTVEKTASFFAFVEEDKNMVTAIQELVREERMHQAKVEAAAKKVLDIGLTELTAAQKRWTLLSREYRQEVDATRLVEISLRSVDNLYAQSLKHWTLGKMEKASAALTTAKDTRKKALEHCRLLRCRDACARILAQDQARQESLALLETYIADFDPRKIEGSPFKKHHLFGSAVSVSPSEDCAHATHLLSVSQRDLQGEIRDKIEVQKNRHSGLRPERLLSHEMDEDGQEQCTGTFRQDLRFA